MTGTWKNWTVAVGLAAALGAFPAEAQQGDGDTAADHLRALAVGHQVTLRSAALGEDREALVYLPTGYDRSTAAYPVIYLLDGRASFLHTSGIVDVLSRSGHMPLSIVVGIANTDRRRDFTAVGGPGGVPPAGAEPFLDFIETELTPWVEAHYRTVAHRTLVGHSLGGSFALHAMISRPELFDALIAVSPAITGDEQEVAGGPAPLTVRAEAALKAGGPVPSALFMTMSAGEDPQWIDDLKRFRRLLKRHAPDDLRWEYLELDDEDHMTTVIPSIFDGLKWLYEGWHSGPAVASGSVQALRDRDRRLSERFGYPVSAPENLVNRMGYELLRDDRLDEALEVFRYNVEHYPESANVHDSLGDALSAQGQAEAALRRYELACARAEANGDPTLPAYRANRERARQRLQLLDRGADDGAVRRDFARVGGGRLYYEVAGHGPAVVLIHGGLLDRRMWDDQMAVLSSRFTVIRYDVVGHGLSDSPIGPHRGYEDLARLLDHLGIRKAAVIGLSLGGRIGIDFALAQPERITALVAVSPGMSGWEFAGEDLAALNAEYASAYRSGDTEAVVEAFIRAWTDGPHRTPEQVDPAVRERVRAMATDGVAPGRGERQLQELDPPATQRLEKIRAPTLVVLGALDMSDIHAIAAELQRRVPGARTVRIQEAAHMVNMEQPEEFEQAVMPFLERVIGN